MPRYGNRWLWSVIELQRAVHHLRAHHNDGHIRMSDIGRAALAVCGRSNAARVLRDRLVEADCLAVSTARGRAADYLLTADAEDCIAVADDRADDDEAPRVYGPSAVT